MTTHIAGPHQAGTYAALVGQPHTSHLKAPVERVRWWQTERAHEITADLGDFAEDIYQIAIVAMAVALVLIVAGLAALSLWPISPHFASGVAAALPVSVAALVLWLRRRPASPAAPAVAPECERPVVDDWDSVEAAFRAGAQ